MAILTPKLTTEPTYCPIYPIKNVAGSAITTAIPHSTRHVYQILYITIDGEMAETIKLAKGFVIDIQRLVGQLYIPSPLPPRTDLHP
jgi:hypothetical protein